MKSEQCDYVIKGNLKKNSNNVHEEKKNHKCDICDETFNQKGDLCISLVRITIQKVIVFHDIIGAIA